MGKHAFQTLLEEMQVHSAINCSVQNRPSIIKREANQIFHNGEYYTNMIDY